MATSLKTVLTAYISAALSNPLDLVTGAAPLEYSKKMTWTNGTTIDKADLVFSDTRTITASSNEDLDLAGVLTSIYGATLTFVELKAILIVAAVANTNNVRVTRPASNGVPLFLAASDGIDVPPGGLFFWACPADGKVTVTASTGDLINVANSSSGTSVTYDVVIVGASA
jgi:hypothetical protein